MERKLLRLNAVMDRTGLSRSTIYRKISLGEFPPPVKLGVGEGVRAIGFPSDQIDDWIDETIQGASK